MPDAWGYGLECVVRERILVGWRDQDKEENNYFGCLSQGKYGCVDCKGNLSLEIHKSECADPTSVLAKFHLPVKIPSSKSKHAKDMFVVLPTSALSMTIISEGDVPEGACKYLSSTSSEASLIRIRLELTGSLVPYAVMPEMPRRRNQVGKRVRGTAGKMIKNLKSLCEARGWDVFLVVDRTIHERIDGVCRLLRAGSIHEPSINVCSVYSDGTRGMVNNWQDYPYSQDEAPPPYIDVRERLKGDSSASRKSPELCWNTDPQLWPNPAAGSGECPTDQAFITGKRKKGDTPPFLSHKHPRREQPTAMRGRGSAATPERGPSDPDPQDFAQIPDWAGTTIPDTTTSGSQSQPSPMMLKGDGAEGGEVPSHSRCTSDCRVEGGGLYLKLIQFLLYALRRDADACDTYMDHLLAMGRHVNGRDEEAFLDVLCCCLCDLSERAARRRLPAVPVPRPLTPAAMSSRVRAVSKWIARELSVSICLGLECQLDRIHEIIAEKAEVVGRPDEEVCAEFRARDAEVLAAAFCMADGFEGNRGRENCPVLCVGCVARVC